MIVLKSLFSLALVVALIWGYMHEQEFIEFEDYIYNVIMKACHKGDQEKTGGRK